MSVSQLHHHDLLRRSLPHPSINAEDTKIRSSHFGKADGHGDCCTKLDRPDRVELFTIKAPHLDTAVPRPISQTNGRLIAGIPGQTRHFLSIGNLPRIALFELIMVLHVVSPFTFKSPMAHCLPPEH